MQFDMVDGQWIEVNKVGGLERWLWEVVKKEKKNDNEGVMGKGKAME